MHDPTHALREGPHDIDACCEHLTLPAGAQTRAATRTGGWTGEVAYVLMGYPRISETFITQEIHLLETLGAKLRLFAIKRGDTDQVQDNVARIHAPLTYLPPVTSLSGTRLLPWLAQNLPRYWAAHARVARRRPGAWLAALGSVIRMTWRYRPSWHAAPRKVFVKEFLQAGFIADRIATEGTARHLHGHFCHGATTITWLASRMTGLPFSFTAHAKDIYQSDQNPGDLLPRKMAAARFVATCTDANRRHLEALSPRPGIVRTIYHGLDTQYFAPPAGKIDADVPTILAVGRLVEKKGFRYLIEACAVLKSAGCRFRCLIVGEDGNQRPEIERLVAMHDMADIVTLRGPVTHGALRQLYAEAAMFVLPCLVASDGDRDGIPNVLAEAMAMGLPVITTGVSGIPELVRAGRDGVIVGDRDAAALAEALHELLQDPARRRRLGEAARARVLDIFDARSTTVALRTLFAREMQTAERQE